MTDTEKFDCPRCQITSQLGTCSQCGLVLNAQSDHHDWQSRLGDVSSPAQPFQNEFQNHQSQKKTGPTAWSLSHGNLLEKYLHQLKMILTEPSRSFATLPEEAKATNALAFALVTNWLAAAMSFMWSWLFGAALFEKITSAIQLATGIGSFDEGRAQMMMSWFWGVGSLLLDPFFTLFSILFHSFLIFVGAKLIVSTDSQSRPREVAFESILKIICYGMTPVILSAIPVFGGLAAGIGVFTFTVIGIKEFYRTTTGRSVFVVLFPKLIFLTTLVVLFVLFFGLIMGLIGGMVG